MIKSSRYLFLLIFFTILVYLNSFGNGFVWDDLNNVVNNKELGGTAVYKTLFFKIQPHAHFYRPIPSLTIALDNLLWGKNPFGYHLTNLLFHIFNTILVFYIALHLADSLLISFTCAILFAVHPVHTEAITYISGRCDPICGFFLFAAFLFYLKSHDAIKHRQFVYFSAALLSFLSGLLSKEIAIIFPLIIFAYEQLYSNSNLKVSMRRVMPFFAVLSSFLAFRYICLGIPNVGIDLNKVFLIPKILLYYIRLLILPVNLHMQHRLQDSAFLINMPVILSLLILAVFIFISFHLAQKRFMRFGLVFFLICLLPFLGILRLNAEISEHWLYITSFGFFLFISGLLAQAKPLHGKIILPIAVLTLSILTLQRNIAWNDDIAIYQDTLEYRQDDHRLHYNLGNAYLRRGMFDDAINEYSIALRQKPDYPYALNNLKIVTTLAFADEVHFDHSFYKNVLTEFLKDGEVDYRSLKNKPLDLDAYLKNAAELRTEELNNMPANERIAFYLNIYNAITLKVITQYYPVKSIKDIPGVWDKLRFKVAGEERTLNNIEHDILRKEFHEPRVHFALVCASKSCPKLSGEPFNGKDLYKQLDREARKFINDKTKVLLDKDKGVLYLSSIFKWFGKDFGEPLEFILRYMPSDESKFVKERNPRIKYLNYDWSLNDKL